MYAKETKTSERLESIKYDFKVLIKDIEVESSDLLENEDPITARVIGMDLYGRVEIEFSEEIEEEDFDISFYVQIGDRSI